MVRNFIVGAILVFMLVWTIFQVYDHEKEDHLATVGNNRSNDVETLSKIAEEDKDSENVVGIYKGNIAPDFTLETLDGKTVKLSDFRGEKILLNFWASWCPPCRAEMPDIQKVHKNHDVAILAVNLTNAETSVESVKEFVNDFQLTFPILLDKKLEVANTYGIQPIPTSFLIDSKGRIANIVIGPMNEATLIQQFNEMD